MNKCLALDVDDVGIAALRGVARAAEGRLDALDVAATAEIDADALGHGRSAREALLDVDLHVLGEEAPAGRYAQAAPESAIRAVRRCSPFKLPKNKFEAWKEVRVRFEPVIESRAELPDGRLLALFRNSRARRAGLELEAKPTFFTVPQ